VVVSNLGSSSIELRVSIASAADERPVFIANARDPRDSPRRSRHRDPLSDLQRFLEDIREPAWDDKPSRLAS